jgi:hypothetical protein
MEACHRQAAKVHRMGRSQESRHQRQRMGGTGGLTRPYGDGSDPGVVERWPALIATPVGGTSTSGATPPPPCPPLQGRRSSSAVEDERGATGASPGGQAGASVNEVRGACPLEDA